MVWWKLGASGYDPDEVSDNLKKKSVSQMMCFGNFAHVAAVSLLIQFLGGNLWSILVVLAAIPIQCELQIRKLTNFLWPVVSK